MAGNRYKPEGMLINTPENREFISSPQGLERAMAQGRILEATALLCDGGQNLHVDLYGIRGIIPKREAIWCRDGETPKDIAIITRVGKAVCFKVISIEKSGGEVRAILSRRAAQIDCVRYYLDGLICGDIIPARVTHLENFGAFVDIGCGIYSLLSIDCISVSRISHPRDRFNAGAFIFVAVKSIDEESGRIYVTHRELLGTWEENAAGFEVGQTVAGIIRSVESYGVFVELTPNLAGLAESRGDIKVGGRAAVYIKNIISERMKIKLVIIDSHPGDQMYAQSGAGEIKYFIDPARQPRIDRWVYSPAASEKVIETVFVG